MSRPIAAELKKALINYGSATRSATWSQASYFENKDETKTYEAEAERALLDVANGIDELATALAASQEREAKLVEALSKTIDAFIVYGDRGYPTPAQVAVAMSALALVQPAKEPK